MIGLNIKRFLLKLPTYIFLFILNTLTAQTVNWNKPIFAGSEGFSALVDDNAIYSLFNTSHNFSDTEYYDTLQVPITFHDGNNLFIVKTDMGFNPQWIKPIETTWCFSTPVLKVSPSHKLIFGAKVYDRFKVDSIDLFFSVHTNPPFVLAQFDDLGKVEWINLIQSDGWCNILSDIGFDTEGNIYYTGYYQGGISFGDISNSGEFIPKISFPNSNSHAISFIAKYSSNGKFLEVKTFPVSNNMGGAYFSIESLTIDKDNNIYVTGWFDGQTQIDNTMIESYGVQIFILKLNNEMKLIWSKVFGPSGFLTMQKGSSLALDVNNNNLYITGNVIGNTDFGNGIVEVNDKNIFLAKYSTDGMLKWVRTSGCWSGAASYTEMGRKVFVDKDDFVFLGGNFSYTLHVGDTNMYVYIDPNVSNSYEDIFVAKYFANGDFSWAIHAGGIYNDNLTSISADHNNNVVVCGRSSYQVQFGEYTCVPNSCHSGFIAPIKDYPEINRYETNFGVNDKETIPKKLNISPNPFHDYCILKIKNSYKSKIDIQIIDCRGFNILSEAIISNENDLIWQIRLSNHPSGIYFLKLIIDGEVFYYKLLKL